MPANVVAIAMKAQPGAELACQPQNYKFEHSGSFQEHGVISYYATQTLTQATSVESWLELMNVLSSCDFRLGRLPEFYLPSLQILGNTAARLPGNPVSSLSENSK